MAYEITTGFKTTDPNTNATQDLGSRYITKDYLLDVYPNIASSTGNRKAPGLWTWGWNTFGQLGNGNFTFYSSPVQVGSLANWKLISGGNFHAHAVKTDGTLWAWGLNFTDGRLGFNTLTNLYYSSPVQVGALTNWKYVGHNSDHTTAIKTDGTLWAWGANQYRQLGHINGSNYSSPVAVGALTNWKLVDNGYFHTLAIKTNGSLWSWGWNRYGQCGHNTSSASVYYSSPTQVGALTNWKSISAGGSHSSFAIKTDGTLWAWGMNVVGQLGIGSTGNYVSTPVQVGALTNWKQVSSGSSDNNPLELNHTTSHTLAIKTDGTLWAVGGRNDWGQLGLGTTTNISTPVQIGTLTNWKSIATMQETSFALKTDGTLWAWGYNGNGSIGDRTTVSKSSPIQIGSLTNWKSISAGKFVSAAIQDGYI
jgi:alpha-tubulin suppressor-like RCC1 family protein